MQHLTYSQLITREILEHNVRGLELIMDDIADEIGDDYVDVRIHEDEYMLTEYENYKNITFLELAVILNDAPIVQYLCENYMFSFNGTSNDLNKDTYTALHLASQLGHNEVAKILCKSNAFDPFQPCFENTKLTPFNIAVKNGNKELAQWFLDYVTENARKQLN